MPKLNRGLVTSIIEDIREFGAVANEMCSWIGKVEHLSWRFPTRSARNVNAMAIVERHKGSAGEMYILLLEMAYDRMHFVLRLVVEFMDSYPFIEDFFKDQVIRVKRPRNMSLANIIRTLWNRLKLIPETVTRNMVCEKVKPVCEMILTAESLLQIKTKHLENSVFASQLSRGCQASGSLFHCENCSCASKAVKDLANIFGTALQEINTSSVIVAEREVICADLFEKTQWAVMTKLVEAIDADAKTLLKKTSAIRAKSEADISQLEKSVQSFSAELETQKTEKSSLEKRVRESTDQLHAINSQLHQVKNTNMELVEKNCVLAESVSNSKDKLENSETLLAAAVKQMAEMAESKLALENAVKNLHEEITAAREASFIETEKLAKSLDRLRDEKVSTEKRYLEEVEDLKQRHGEVVEKLQEDARRCASASVDRFLTDTKMQTEEQKCACETAEILVPKGDPEIDMAQQFVSNENAIERLTRQNERLSRTLTRLKEHRKISDIRKIIDED